MDKAHGTTEEKLSAIEKHLTEIYTEAQKGVEKQWKEYIKQSGEKIASAEERYSGAVESGNDDKIKKAKKALEKEKQLQTIYNKKYKRLTTEYAERILHVNEIAMAYVNGNLADIYALNYNSFEDNLSESENDIVKGYSFELTDAQTVKNLAMNDDTLLPYREIDGQKDIRWNVKSVNAQVLQGILQGETMDEIAARLSQVTGMNAKSAIKNARTSVTSAENKGRLDSYIQAEQDGIIMKKRWLATPGSRTRESHRLLNGQQADINKPFDSILGDIMYPGDPSAAPANVYNCRCTLTTEILGFKKVSEEESPVHKIAEGKNIIDKWKRRENEFDFEIEDVINAQGFDGLPQVVDEKQFNKAVTESKFIAQRNYSAETQEVLDEYRNQLYNGKWYVDCSTGGAQYGQGMYCAADYNGQLTDGIKNEMKHYQTLGNERGNKYSYTETLTLDKNSKIIKFDDLKTDFYEKTDERNIFLNMLGDDIDDNNMAIIHREILRDATDEQRKIAKKMESKLEDEYDDIIDKYEDMFDAAKEKSKEYKNMDLGTYATLMGYDAINAEGHGESSSYTVILNRTKLIIKGDKND